MYWQQTVCGAGFKLHWLHYWHCVLMAAQACFQIWPLTTVPLTTFNMNFWALSNIPERIPTKKGSKMWDLLKCDHHITISQLLRLITQPTGQCCSITVIKVIWIQTHQCCLVRELTRFWNTANIIQVKKSMKSAKSVLCVAMNCSVIVMWVNYTKYSIECFFSEY